MPDTLALEALEWMKANQRLHALILPVAGPRASDQEIARGFAAVQDALARLRAKLEDLQEGRS